MLRVKLRRAYGLLAAGLAAFGPAVASDRKACIPVAGDRIRGADLIASGLPFQDVDADLDLGAAPLPGLVRVLRPGGPFGGACFERKTKTLRADDLEGAMRKALAGREVRVEILEFSKLDVPDSTIEFPLPSLSRPPAAQADAPVLWRGRAVYAERRSLPIWARVRLSVSAKCLTAAHDLASGHLLAGSDVVEKTAWRFPLSEPVELHPDDVVGLATTRRVAAGEPLDRRLLIAPNVIEAGQSIEVRVVGAGTELIATATAERGGKLGEMIPAKNEQSGKRFRARITGPGRVVVVVPERL